MSPCCALTERDRAVLPDEPRAEKGCDFGAARQFPQFGNPAGEEDCQDA
jgi:hypothetical protein